MIVWTWWIRQELDNDEEWLRQWWNVDYIRIRQGLDKDKTNTRYIRHGLEKEKRDKIRIRQGLDKNKTLIGSG